MHVLVDIHPSSSYYYFMLYHRLYVVNFSDVVTTSELSPPASFFSIFMKKMNKNIDNWQIAHLHAVDFYDDVVEIDFRYFEL